MNMKKKYIVMIVIVLLIMIAIAGWFVYKQIEKNGREYEIEKISVENYEYFILRQDGKYGVINKVGDIVIDPEYKNVIIPNPQKAVFVCYDENNDTKILNQNGEQLFSEYAKIEPIRLKNIASDLMYEKNLLTYQQDEKLGLINLEGEVIAKPIYESIEGLPYKEGELLVQLEGKYGVINNKGNYLVDPEYDQINVDNYTTEEDGYKHAGYIVSNTTENGYRYGYVDINGNVLLEPEYTEVSRIINIKDNDNIYLIVAQNGQYGMFKNQEQIIGNEYQSISYNSESNTLTLEKTRRYGMATLDGEVVIPVEFAQVDSTGKYIYTTDVDGNVKVYQEDGNPAEIDSNVYILETENENYQIKIDNSQGSVYSILNKNGEQITTQNYSYINYLYDNYFIVSVTGGKVGVINDKEEPIIEIQYDSIEKVEGTDYIITRLSENSSTQLYDKNFKELCEMTNAIVQTEENYVKVYNDTETKYFDLEGNEKQNTEILSNNQIYAKSQDGKWGFVDKSGNVVVDYIYDKVTDLNSYGYAGIKLDGKWGVVNSNGEVIVEPTYTLNTPTEPEFIKDYYKVEYGYGEFYYTK